MTAISSKDAKNPKEVPSNSPGLNNPWHSVGLPWIEMASVGQDDSVFRGEEESEAPMSLFLRALRN